MRSKWRRNVSSREPGALGSTTPGRLTVVQLTAKNGAARGALTQKVPKIRFKGASSEADVLREMSRLNPEH